MSVVIGTESPNKSDVFGQKKGGDTKVVDRKLIIGDNTFYAHNIQEEFRPPPTASAVG